MAFGFKTRKRLTIALLCIGLPVYIVAIVSLMNSIARPPIWLEALIYVVSGVIWVFPFKSIFRGVGQADPDE